HWYLPMSLKIAGWQVAIAHLLFDLKTSAAREVSHYCRADASRRGKIRRQRLDASQQSFS
ncbi:MAG: hypothetical protein OXF64_01570, partial [bacterium]|nr:hypothetical protein [bacterium]